MQLAALVRSAFKRPGYWLSFTATLAVIAGGAVAVFALFEAYLLRPAGFPDEDRVDFMTMSMSRPGLTETAYSLPTYRDLREKLSGYEALTIVTRLRTVLTGKQRGEQISALEAVPSFFDVFRVKPVIGRIFRPDEDERSGVRRVILFYPLWQHRYGGDPTIIGKTIEMDGAGWAVIGVLPPEHRFRSTEVLAIRTL